MYIFFVLFFAFNILVEVIFPVEKNLVSVFFLSCGEQDFGVTPVIQVELGASPLFDLRIIRPGNSLKDMFPELRDSEVSQSTEKFSKLLFRFVAFKVEGKQSQVHEFMKQLLVLKGDVDLFVFEGMRGYIMAGRIAFVVEPHVR